MRFRPAPDNEIPVSVPLDRVLNRTDALVLWLSDLHVYSTGFEFTVHARRRSADVMLDVYGFGKPSPSQASAPLLIGLGYADGTYSSNLPGSDNAGGLHHRGSTGGPGSAHVTFFRHPFPPAGPIRVVTAWPYFSVPERIVELDGHVLGSAAERVETLWPEPKPTARPQFTGGHTRHPLDLVPGGWFAAHYSPPPPPPENGRRFVITDHDDAD
ncbi:MAG TPA: hypothetical protein VIW24_02165 [Aldersonia sp.]